MGVDIYTRSGVVVKASRLVQIIREENVRQACRALLRYTSKMLKAIREHAESESLSESRRNPLQRSAAILANIFESLSIDTSVDDLRAMLLNMAPGVIDG